MPVPRFGLGCHYLRCPVQALPSSTQGPLKPTHLFTPPLCWKLTNRQILRQRACQARSVTAEQPLLQPQINIQPPEIPCWHRRSVSNMVCRHQNPPPVRGPHWPHSIAKSHRDMWANWTVSGVPRIGPHTVTKRGRASSAWDEGKTLVAPPAGFVARFTVRHELIF